MNDKGIHCINSEIPYKLSEMSDYESKFYLAQEHEDLLSILLAFDQFCRSHEILYSIADGTLLGAMRHADFIPWDDDADVMLTKDEYVKLRKALKQGGNIKLFKVSFLDRVSTPEMLSKGKYIDLFINEDMPKSKNVFGCKKLITAFLRTSFRGMPENYRQRCYSKGKKLIHRTLNLISCVLSHIVIGNRNVFDLNERAVAIGKYKSSGIYTRYTSRMYETKRRFDKVSYDEGYANIAFRGHILMSIKNADTFLREMYGDYMKLLPEDKRKPEHPVNMLDAAENCVCRYN